jgi:WD40 repeat protein
LLGLRGIDPFADLATADENANKKISLENLLLEDGDGKYPCHPQLKIPDASGTMNALCVSYGSFRDNDLDAIICGGVDKILRIYQRGERGCEDNEINGQTIPILCRQYEFSAPILAIASFGTLVSASFMDGRHALIDLSLPMATSPPQIYQTHTKYVVGTGWSSDGKYLYTCSHDKSIALFRVSRSLSLSLSLSPLSMSDFFSEIMLSPHLMPQLHHQILS